VSALDERPSISERGGRGKVSRLAHSSGGSIRQLLDGEPSARAEAAARGGVEQFGGAPSMVASLGARPRSSLGNGPRSPRA